MTLSQTPIHIYIGFFISMYIYMVTLKNTVLIFIIFSVKQSV